MTFLLLLACTDKSGDDTAPAFEGPALSHVPPGSVLEGQPLSVSVTAVDDDGLGPVTLFHRTEGAATWTQVPMTGAGDDTWTAEVDGTDINAPAFEYYFKAVDAGETPASSYLPAESTAAPYSVPIGVEGLPLPFREDFELKGKASSLSDLGWGSASGGFRGYPWQSVSTLAHGGTSSALHPHGYEDISQIEDWLISPPLDFSGVTTAQVTWWEYGEDVTAAVHALHISTGSRDPLDGDYVPVAKSLPPPLEEAWGRSAVYDLSAWVGNPTVYLAWFWTGIEADDWYVDDIVVQELQPDLELTWSISPSPVGPGEATVLHAEVTNAGLVSATGASLSLTFPGGEATVSGAGALGDLAPGASAAVELDVSIAASAADNSYAPVEFTLAHATESIVVPDQLLIGEASTATIGWRAAAEGSLNVRVGVGDLDAPDFEALLVAKQVTTGSDEYSLDLTGLTTQLPPEAGANRWWAEVSTGGGGAVTSFVLEHDGQTYGATSVPNIAAGGSDVVWLPEPPAFSVSVVAPTAVEPGAAGQSLTLSLTNAGAATDGPLQATLGSTDPDVTLVSAGPVVVDADGFPAGGRTSFSGFVFDVAATHTDSTPLELELTLQDDAESWTLPLEVAVPFPVFRITSVEVDDDGRDGILDPGESGELTFTLTNVGDLASTGALNATLLLEASSTATADIPVVSESYSTMGAGSTRDADAFEVLSIAGAEGDTLDLLLLLTDSARSYEARTTFVLGEPPWRAMTPTDDAIGDALGGWSFDFMNGTYRVRDGVLQMRVTSATPYDGTAYFEAWGTSSGGDYTYYQFVFNGGHVTWQGYDYGWTELGENDPTYVDANTVQIDIPLDTLGLILDEISLGWGSGWCGPPEYFCDHWPDGWGYPYYSFSTAGWYSLEW